MNEQFDIPVVLFIFKRYKTVLQIIDRIRQVKPRTVYLIGDGTRNIDEEAKVLEAREIIEKSIDWDCNIIKNYASSNRGVYENIGKGAIWVLKQEKSAIFLEDDNLPEISFFYYCRELLERYENNQEILWINGTNYLGEYFPENNADYVFTKHLLPCGWASWSEKFINFYDGDLLSLGDLEKQNNFKKSYNSEILFQQQWHSINTTKRKLELKNPVSWDFQMCYSIRANMLYGIAPRTNQIKNIGVDSDSTHGGTSMNIEMTSRFCGVESKKLSLPLKHPEKIELDKEFEDMNDKIIRWPLRTQILYRMCYLVKPLLRMHKYDSMSLVVKKCKEKFKNVP